MLIIYSFLTLLNLPVERTGHKPPCVKRGVTKPLLTRFKTENTHAQILDSKVGFMRLLGGTPIPQKQTLSLRTINQ